MVPAKRCVFLVNFRVPSMPPDKIAVIEELFFIFIVFDFII